MISGHLIRGLNEVNEKEVTGKNIHPVQRLEVGVRLTFSRKTRETRVAGVGISEGKRRQDQRDHWGSDPRKDLGFNSK